MSWVRFPALALILGALATPGWALTPSETPLMDRMRSAGLERVEPFSTPAPGARGFLPGEGGLGVLLFAGCGPGGEASRDAALGAAVDLARTPRRHTLELVLCAAGGAGPQAARRAADRWLDLHPEMAARDSVLAALHLEVGERAGVASVGLLLAAEGSDGRRLPPAWVAHAALGGARAAGGGLAFGEPGWPLMGQLLGRYGRLRAVSGAEPFLSAGLPALTLAGGAPAAGWPATLAATVRRLDSLAGRPREDDVYLALGGRIWTRRDLYWAGLAVWAVLIASGLPGPWRGAGSGQRRRRGRRYVPGFVFRMLFLLALLSAPVATLLLVAPASLLTLASSRRRLVVNILQALAAAPTVVFAGYWAVALLSGRVAAWPAQPLRLALVVGAVVLAVGSVDGSPPDEATAVKDQAG